MFTGSGATLAFLLYDPLSGSKIPAEALLDLTALLPDSAPPPALRRLDPDNLPSAAKEALALNHSKGGSGMRMLLVRKEDTSKVEDVLPPGGKTIEGRRDFVQAFENFFGTGGDVENKGKLSSPAPSKVRRFVLVTCLVWFGLVYLEVHVKSLMAVFSQTAGTKKGLFSILVS